MSIARAIPELYITDANSPQDLKGKDKPKVGKKMEIREIRGSDGNKLATIFGWNDGELMSPEA